LEKISSRQTEGRKGEGSRHIEKTKIVSILGKNKKKKGNEGGPAAWMVAVADKQFRTDHRKGKKSSDRWRGGMFLMSSEGKKEVPVERNQGKSEKFSSVGRLGRPRAVLGGERFRERIRSFFFAWKIKDQRTLLAAT